MFVLSFFAWAIVTFVLLLLLFMFLKILSWEKKTPMMSVHPFIPCVCILIYIEADDLMTMRPRM